MSHNIDDPRHPWGRLTAAARSARQENDPSAPYGFTTRVAALAFAQERRVVSLLERFALRAVGVAALLALCSVALNYQAFSESPVNTVAQSQSEDVDLTAADDAVSLVIDFAD